jgi:hypothetical protein
MSRATGKIRGFTRYLRWLRAEAEAFCLPVKTRVVGHCHHHFDVWGYGRRNSTLRRLHLEALFLAFERALKQMESSAAQQVFVSVAPTAQAEQDALCYYLPDPAEPSWDYSNVKWDVPPPPFLKPFVVGKPWQLGVVRVEKLDWWIVRAISQRSKHAR